MMVKKLLAENETLRELLAGILISGFSMQLLLVIFTKHFAYYAIGLWTGIAAALIMAVHMAYALDTALSLGEKGAAAYIRKKSIVRYVLVCILLVLAGITNFGSPVTLLLGVMGLKTGAYLQPVTHKMIIKLNRKQGR
ncbi:MAG TPA: hypothetical protein PLU43_01325 [Lachnospiraceae bacterium]|nr:hypothetical protein [Lachnospiraceae bacterium]